MTNIHKKSIGTLETNSCSYKSEKETSDKCNQRLKCGEIVLLENDWRLIFSCSFCNIEFKKLEGIVKHTLKEHLMSTAYNGKLRSANKKRHCTTFLSDEKTGIKDDPEGVVDWENDETYFGEISEDQILEPKVKLIEDEILDNEPKIGDEVVDNDDFKLSNIKIETLDLQPKTNNNNLQTDNKSDLKYNCHICNKSVPTMKQLKNHIRRHSLNKSYKCEFCGASFVDSSNYKVHRFRHLGIKPHSCTQCEKSFTSSTELKLHVRTHTGEKPYNCDQCELSFSSCTHLKAHKRRHFNERPYVCSTCGKSFFDSKLLRDHEVGHSSERPFLCSECSMTFTRRKALQEHIKLHSNVKKYKCSICFKTFAQNPGLHSHMKKHNKEMLAELLDMEGGLDTEVEVNEYK